MKKTTVAILFLFISLTSQAKAEKISLNEIVKNNIILEIEGDDLRINDLPLCAYDSGYTIPASISSSLQAESICIFLGEQLTNKSKAALGLRNDSKLQHVSVEFEEVKRTDCAIVGFGGIIQRKSAKAILTKVSCIKDNRSRKN